MDNSKSVAIAVYRCEDPAMLDRVSMGLDAQVWGTLIALAGCVIGPILLHMNVSFEAFGTVTAVMLSAASAIWLTRVPGAGHGGIRPMNVVAMAIGSGAIVVPAAVLRMNPGERFQVATLTLFVLAGLFWFVGECSRLRLLEHHAHAIPGRHYAHEARALRHGAYAMFGVIGLGLLPVAMHRAGVVANVNVSLILMISVGLLTFTLMGALVHGRASMALRRQASFSRSVRECMGMVDPRLLPDEPDWDVPDLRPVTIVPAIGSRRGS